MNAGVVFRVVIASVLLAIVIGAGFAILLRQIDSLRESGREVTHSRNENAAADVLERRVIDLETGVRGFVITAQPRFLEPWAAARSAIPRETKTLAALVDTPEQARRVRKLIGDINSYIQDYGVPLVAEVRRNRGAGLSVAITAEGKRRVDALRAQFDGLRAAERARLAARQQRDDVNASRAATLATLALVASVILILLFGLYMVRAIAVPLRGAAAMADRLAGGDLSVRLPETGIGEVGTLQRAFNRMGSSLETSREELRRLADEQAALRRVATLVAHAAPPAAAFEAVASETRRMLSVDASALLRFESDGNATLVAADSRLPLPVRVGERLTLEDDMAASRVRNTGRPARVEGDEAPADPISQRLRSLGYGGSVGAPIVVEDHLWGAMVTAWPVGRAIPPDAEQRLVQFTELVATAIANTQAQAELTASRVRIVASADEARRRIERNLHDGAQQRLVSLALQLRAAQAAVPPDEDLAAELDSVATGLTGALDELRELARGIHPAILAEGGLERALRALARRSNVPVELNIDTPRSLPEPVEIAAYYIVSEALTNAAKHAAATAVTVSVDVAESGDVLRIYVRDDGVGGADFAGGSGLVGLRDRVEALGGRIGLESSPGHGTRLSVELPLADDPRERAARQGHEHL